MKICALCEKTLKQDRDLFEVGLSNMMYYGCENLEIDDNKKCIQLFAKFLYELYRPELDLD